MKLQHMLLLFAICGVGYAQQGISVDTEVWGNLRMATNHSGYDPGRNGGGVSVGLQKPIIPHYPARLAVEFGAAGTGNYLAAKAGIERPVEIGTSRWNYIPGLNLLQGAALFRPKSLYMWGVEQTNVVQFRMKNTGGPGLVIGFRYYGFPGYQEYSPIRHFFDIRTGLRYTF